MGIGLRATKLIGAGIVLILGFVCSAILPLYMKKNEAIVSKAQAFSGGIFLAIGFLHMLPEASNTLEHDDRTLYIPDPEDGGNKPFPLSTFCLCAMVIFILFLEKVLLPDMDEFLGQNIKDKKCDAPCCVEIAETAPVATTKSSLEVMEKDRPLAYALLLILCIHSIFAGISAGLATTIRSALLILVAIVAHKGFAGFAMGCEFVKAGLKRPFHIKLALVFSLVTPLGIAIGTGTHRVLDDSNVLPWIDGIFGAFGSGIFVYLAMTIVFTEYFYGDKAQRLTSFLFLCTGFVLMAVPAVFA